eukprot:jgi/Chlat1/2793/Chrsp187S02914
MRQLLRPIALYKCKGKNAIMSIVHAVMESEEEFRTPQSEDLTDSELVLVNRILDGDGDEARARMAALEPSTSNSTEDTEMRSSTSTPHSDVTDDFEHDGGVVGGRGGFTYEPCLPNSHSYLGEVDDISDGGARMVGGGQILVLPMFYLEGIVLFPNDKLPLRVLQPRFKAAVERAMRDDGPAKHVIGVLYVSRRRNALQVSFGGVGTTAEIRALRRQPDGSLNLIAKGRQRFRLLRSLVEADGALTAEVQIIEELPALHLPSGAFGKVAASAGDAACSSVQRRKRPSVAALAYWPSFVYRIYDAYELARRLQDMLITLFPATFMAHILDPESLSFWVASKLPLQDSARQRLLEIPATDQRLREEIHLLETLGVLRCRTCGVEVGRKEDVMNMSEDGPINAFVNSQGYVHEALTMRMVRGLVCEGRPETANSWFPGYAWTIAYCETCGEHMGWLFTAADRIALPKGHPERFWGLRRASLTEQAADA